MEIHRRARPSSNNESNDPPSKQRINGASSSSSMHPSASRRPINSPYAPTSSSSSTFDAILLKIIQLLLVTSAVWFFYLIVAVNSPEKQLDTNNNAVSGDLTIPAISGGSSSSTSDSLRGSLPSWLKPVKVDPDAMAAARHEIDEIRNTFYTRYGGKSEALQMLKKGILTFESKKHATDKAAVHATADRFLSTIVRYEQQQQQQQQQQQMQSNNNNQQQQQQQHQPEFIMAFGGYSVTVGRGSYFNQSYPFVMERILSPIFQQPPLGIKFTVRNSAIGGIPSFPYGWCLPNFLGQDAHSSSWDYAMNEGNGASGLESYIRQALLTPNSPPLFVMLDVKSKPRLDILQTYVDLGYLPDPIALGGRDAVSSKLLSLPEKDRPIGLQRWDEWGAPKGAPGQSPWHPKKMEHELMGWMMAMHILEAVDVALDIMEKDENWKEGVLKREQSAKTVMKSQSDGEVILPPPVTDAKRTGVESLLHGAPSESDSSKWHMHRIACRTSFLPNVSGHLESIIESGVTKDDADMIESRDDSLFDGGWVMDVGKLERETKQKVMKYGGLGYIDMKTALYGIPSSGALKLWLPYELPVGESVSTDSPASKFFNAIVVCEVNEKRGDKECNMLSDLSFRVGGVAVPQHDVSRVNGAASYLKKDICIHVRIPDEGIVSLKSGTEFGLAVEVTVTGSEVSRENGACSISHVIWEHS